MISRWRRFRFQISLRTIFLGVAAISTLLAYWVHVVAPQIARKRALARMSELGANVDLLPDALHISISGGDKVEEIIALLAYFPKVQLSLGGGVTDEEITGLAGAANVEALLVYSNRITDVGMRSVAQMRGVREILMTGVGIGCDSIGAFAGMEGLQHLSVDGLQFDFCVIDEVVKLADLEELELTYMRIAEGDIRRVSMLRKLTSLHLACRRMPSQSFYEIIACKGLKDLYVSGITLPEPTPGAIYLPTKLESLTLVRCKISAAAMRQIANASRLKTLSLEDSRIAKGGLAYIREIASLERLDLERVIVSDRDLRRIAKLPSLNHISISGKRITNAGLEALARMNSLTSLEANDVNATEECIGRVTKAMNSKPGTAVIDAAITSSHLALGLSPIRRLSVQASLLSRRTQPARRWRSARAKRPRASPVASLRLSESSPIPLRIYAFRVAELVTIPGPAAGRDLEANTRHGSRNRHRFRYGFALTS